VIPMRDNHWLGSRDNHWNGFRDNHWRDNHW
jgi:hypothetical protein